MSSILDSLDKKTFAKGFVSVSDRYYEHKFYTGFSTATDNLDQCVSFHTNRLCMISLSERHAIVAGKKMIARVNFEVDKQTNRLTNAASGKGKRGAQKLNANSVICRIQCTDGSNYNVYSCVKGKLLEVNENLVRNPNLLVEKPLSEGYIAFVLPNLDTFNGVKGAMLDRSQYFS